MNTVPIILRDVEATNEGAGGFDNEHEIRRILKKYLLISEDDTTGITVPFDRMCKVLASMNIQISETSKK